MRREDFNASAPGDLVPVTLPTNVSGLAYRPHPLPPNLEFTPLFLQSLSSADRALGELAGLGRNLPNPRIFIRPFVRREAVLSSRIEGTHSDLTDIAAFESGQLQLPAFKQSPPESDAREVLNYVRALDFGLDRIRKIPVSLRVIREMHGHLLEGVRGHETQPGEFRKRQNWIGPEGCSLSDARFVPPSVDSLDECLNLLESYLHASDPLPPLLRLGLIHYQFETIHPFIDGNGRVGRLLMSLLLVNWNLLPAPLLYLSAYFERHRQSYYDGLLAVSQRGSWTEWLMFFLDGVRSQANDAIARAKQLEDLRRTWTETIKANRATSLQLQTLDLLTEQLVIAPNDLVERFKASHQTSISTIRRLEKLGIVREATGQKRNQRYLAPALMEVLS